MSEIRNKIFISSAYRIIFAFLKHDSISFMKIVNNRGPKRDPCGIPEGIEEGTEM